MCKFRLFPSLTLLACTLSVPIMCSALAADNDYEALMTHGRKLMDKKDYNGARADLQKAEDLYNDDTMDNAKKKANAMRDLFWAGVVIATNRDKELTAGSDQGEMFMAGAMQAAPVDTKDPFSYFARGVLYYSADDKQNGVDEISRGLKMKPDETVAYVWRARIYKDMGNKQAEDADLAKAKQLGWGN